MTKIIEGEKDTKSKKPKAVAEVNTGRGMYDLGIFVKFGYKLMT